MDELSPTENKRRSFLKASFALGAVSLLPTTKGVAQAAEEEKFTVKVGPYLQTNFGNEMTILWITSAPSSGWVEYGSSPDKLDKKAYGDSNLGLLDANNTLKKVALKNLSPGNTYYYRICSKEIADFKPYKLTYGATIESPVEQFNNPAEKVNSISFLMLNDIHDRPKSIPHLLDLAKGEKPDFVFFNGDIFDYQTDEKQIIENMLKPCVESFAKQCPFIYVRGNHETRGKFAREFPSYFHQVGYAAFTLGNTRFVVIDTGEDKEDTHPVYAGIVDFDQYRIEQAEKLKQEINSKAFKKADFRIVMMHIPPRYSGDWHGPKECTRLFEPLLNQGRVDLVLSGHTHQYKVHLPDPKTNRYPLVIGGGPTEGKRTLTKVKIENDTLKVSMLNDSGSEVGHYEISKK